MKIKGKIMSTHEIQKLAEVAERKVAKKDNIGLITHGKEGKVKSKDSFKKNLKWIKDKEY